jgi:hypothetical protein
MDSIYLRICMPNLIVSEIESRYNSGKLRQINTFGKVAGTVCIFLFQNQSSPFSMSSSSHSATDAGRQSDNSSRQMSYCRFCSMPDKIYMQCCLSLQSILMGKYRQIPLRSFRHSGCNSGKLRQMSMSGRDLCRAGKPHM